MRKNLKGILILSLGTMSLSGCIYLRQAGPCYGVGCPVFTRGDAPQPAVNAGATTPKALTHPKNRPAAPQLSRQGK